MLRIRMPQHTRLVTCDWNSKAIHYKWKFINSKEPGSQEPRGTDSSHEDQVPMIRHTGQVPVIRNKGSQRKKLVSTVERNCHIPKVNLMERRQSASRVGRKGMTVPCEDQVPMIRRTGQIPVKESVGLQVLCVGSTLLSDHA